MTKARLVYVDSFAARPLAGNPAAVLLLDQEPDDGLGARIGAELDQPATAVLWPGGEPGRFGLRWFTATSELALCGHGTLAAARVLLDSGYGVAGQVRFDTRSGLLDAHAAGDWVQLRFPGLPPAPVADPELASALRGLLTVPVTEVLRTELDLMAVLGSAAEVRAAQPDLEALRVLPVRGLIITAAGPGVEGVTGSGRDRVAGSGPAEDGASSVADFVSRFFAPATGIGEDAVTGSAHCALGPYWIGRLGRQPLTGHQVSARGGIVQVGSDGDSVLLTGPALVRRDLAWTLPAA
jgi:predicted PhzF superfamily epimerase YddE/YHI9